MARFSSRRQAQIRENLNNWDRPPQNEDSEHANASQVVFVYGGALSGVSQAVQILHEESETPTCLVCADADGRWLEDVESALAGGTVLVDGSEWLRDSEGIQALYDKRLVSPSSGLLVRIWADDDEIVRRAASAKRDVSTKGESLRVSALDTRIHKLQMPFAMIANGAYALDQTVRQLALKAKIYV